MRAVPRLLSYTVPFTLQVMKNHGKTSVRVAEKCQVGAIQLVDRVVVLAASVDSNLRHASIALWVGQVNPRSALIPAVLLSYGVPRIS